MTRRMLALLPVLFPLACSSGSASEPAGMAAFLEFEGTPLRLVEFYSTGDVDASAAAGAVVEVDPEAGVLTLAPVDADLVSVGAPVMLLYDEAEDRFAARDVSFLGYGALDLFVRAVPDGAGGRELAVQIASAGFFPEELPVAPLAAAAETDAILAKRLEYVAKFKEILNTPGKTEMDAFAGTVQYVVDENVRIFGGDPTLGDELDKLILADLVDMFVPADYHDEKERFMITAPVLDGVTGGLVADGSLTGFKAELRKGNGRYRHFFMNALVASYIGDFLTNLAARISGGDFEFLDDPTGDIAADLQTNAKGRAFGDFLHDLMEQGGLGDGVSVAQHLRDCFAAPPPVVVTTQTNAMFSDGVGSCGFPTAFTDRVDFRIESTEGERIATLTTIQPSTGDTDIGTVDTVTGAFTATSPDGREVYDGTLELEPHGDGYRVKSGTGTNRYTTPAGCTTTYALGIDGVLVY